MFDRIRKALARLGSPEVHALLPAATVEEALRATFDGHLMPAGFERPKPLKWVRSRKVPVREIIELYPIKGAALAPRWGFSIDFVPHIAAGRVRWHRTPKSALLDFVWDPLDFAGLDGWTFSRFVSSAELPRQAQAFSKTVCRSALADLDRATGLADLPALYREWAARPTARFTMDNYAQAFLAEAFVMGHLRLPGALQCLRDRAAQLGLESSLASELEALLEPTAAS